MIQNKEFVRSFSYTTAKRNRESSKSVKVNGRNWTKTGTEQAITIVGNLFNYFDDKTNNIKQVLFLGMSRQHPKDIQLDVQLGYEVAQENAFTDPFLVYYVHDGICVGALFNQLANYIAEEMNKEFIYTKEELSCKSPA